MQNDSNGSMMQPRKRYCSAYGVRGVSQQTRSRERLTDWCGVWSVVLCAVTLASGGVLLCQCGAKYCSAGATQSVAQWVRADRSVAYPVRREVLLSWSAMQVVMLAVNEVCSAGARKGVARWSAGAGRNVAQLMWGKVHVDQLGLIAVALARLVLCKAFLS